MQKHKHARAQAANKLGINIIAKDLDPGIGKIKTEKIYKPSIGKAAKTPDLGIVRANGNLKEDINLGTSKPNITATENSDLSIGRANIEEIDKSGIGIATEDLHPRNGKVDIEADEPKAQTKQTQ